MHASCNAVFAGRQVRLASTAKPITPSAVSPALVVCFERIGLAGRITGLMPFS